MRTLYLSEGDFGSDEDRQIIHVNCKFVGVKEDFLFRTVRVMWIIEPSCEIQMGGCFCQGMYWNFTYLFINFGLPAQYHELSTYIPVCLLCGLVLLSTFPHLPVPTALWSYLHPPHAPSSQSTWIKKYQCLAKELVPLKIVDG